jgi:hypothetical protein
VLGVAAGYSDTLWRQINRCGHLVKMWSLELLYTLERFERSYGEIIGTCQCCGASQWRMSRQWEHPHPTSLDYYLSNPTHKSSTCRRILPHHMAYQKRSRSAGIISRLKNTVGWFFVREKYCSDWKNKLNKTDYKPDEQGQSLLYCLILFFFLRVENIVTTVPPIFSVCDNCISAYIITSTK